MRVDLQLGSVQGGKAPQDVLGRFVHVVPALVVREVVSEGPQWQFLGENINLVQKQNDRGAQKPA